ncbi:hypothetical protein [Amycolatopsis jiangsuensis]|uniref:Recombination endonuclease VII n=1 Tax=Amycolatopsis jiangsuensis TaxID=1181879 RepID=A0A840IW06_9PSEU|nr:hypothetical protein [Amycolatopsis jiangsuensis]MBB4685923.1 hypothetical protein [Amycolatopsis jiangsuensis]
MTAPDVSCARCGRSRAAETDTLAALAWACTKENGTERWLCPGCARNHARDIEGKLPDEYW